ncbi:MAG: MoaD/ThiS family protein [Actinomycetota bacterium]|nr:MoaD/ThiS family protein [Actinomycetota bacterium]
MSDKSGVVHVRLFAAAKAAAGIAEIDVAAGTIGSISRELISQFSALASILPSCSFLVDGAQPPQGGDLASVGRGAVLDVLPPFAGG